MFRLTALFIILHVGFVFAQDGSFGSFEVEKDVDAFTDENSSLMVGIGIENDNAAFVFRCNSDSETGLDVFVVTDEYLGSEGPVKVDYRLDQEPPAFDTNWNMGTSGRSVFMRDSMQEELKDSFPDHEEVRFRIYDFDGVGHDFLFGLNGFEEAFEALGCGNL